jgi:cation transport ATPase
MLTGDAAGPAYAIAAGVGLPAEDVHAALLPEDKLIMVSRVCDVLHAKRTHLISHYTW